MARDLHPLVRDGEKLTKTVDQFIADCAAKGVSPFKQRFCLEHKIPAEYISRWIERFSEGGSNPDPVKHQALKRLEQASELRQLDRLDASSSCQNAMFLLKSQHGYVEQQHVKHEHSGNVAISVATGVPSATDGTKA